MEILQFHCKRVCMRERHIIGNLFLGKSSYKKKTSYHRCNWVKRKWKKSFFIFIPLIEILK